MQYQVNPADLFPVTAIVRQGCTPRGAGSRGGYNVGSGLELAEAVTRHVTRTRGNPAHAEGPQAIRTGICAWGCGQATLGM